MRAFSMLLRYLLSFVSGLASAAPNKTSKFDAAVDALVGKAGIGPDSPGVAILVRDKKGVVFEKCYGLANLKSKAPITPTTLFELASVSKTMTATAVLILHERGLLSIDEDISKYIPELAGYSKQGPILVSDLLYHTSGLPDYMQFEEVGSRHKGYHVNDDYLDVLAKGPSVNPMEFSVRKKYNYNNTNYLVLATLVERVAKKPFSDFMHDEIFAPAGMTHTFVNDSPTPGRRVPRTVNAIGYEPKKGKHWHESWGVPPERTETMLTVGDGSVWSTLADMARWDEALRRGKFVSAGMWARALKPSTTRNGKTNDYGLGWALYFDGSLIGYGHDGDWGGFNTTYYRYLTNDQTTIILSNRGEFDVNALWESLVQIVG